MILPKKDEFLQSAKTCNLLPLALEMAADLDSPLSLFLKVKGQFLLESVEKGGSVGRYSIIGLGKRAEFILNGQELVHRTYQGNKLENETSNRAPNPLLHIRDYFSRFKTPDYARNFPPFFGGAIGYLGYETVQYFEEIPAATKNSYIPDGIMVVPEILLVYDNVHRNVYIIKCLEAGPDPDAAYQDTVAELKKIENQLVKPLTETNSPCFTDPDTDVAVSMTKKDFMDNVKKCKEYIREGEIIQAVLSQQFSLQTSAAPFELYRTLRILNPSPYLYYLDFGDFHIIGSSPEVMIRVQNGEVLLKPIAGTRPRGKNISEDNNLAKELLDDPKERAEHLMLVDLGRNDLGRIALPGTVDVSDYMEIERYSHVMHIVSTIKAELDPRYDVFDVIKATFPAGTLSGAPKVRAMEIISELEPLKRGPYGGMILNLSYSGNLDSCITIRTLLLKDEKAIIQAGAGIVADSVPETEYYETVNKAKALVRAIQKTRKRLKP